MRALSGVRRGAQLPTARKEPAAREDERARVTSPPLQKRIAMACDTGCNTRMAKTPIFTLRLPPDSKKHLYETAALFGVKPRPFLAQMVAELCSGDATRAHNYVTHLVSRMGVQLTLPLASQVPKERSKRARPKRRAQRPRK